MFLFLPKVGAWNSDLFPHLQLLCKPRGGVATKAPSCRHGTSSTTQGRGCRDLNKKLGVHCGASRWLATPKRWRSLVRGRDKPIHWELRYLLSRWYNRIQTDCQDEFTTTQLRTRSSMHSCWHRLKKLWRLPTYGVKLVRKRCRLELGQGKWGFLEERWDAFGNGFSTTCVLNDESIQLFEDVFGTSLDMNRSPF